MASIFGNALSAEDGALVKETQTSPTSEFQQLLDTHDIPLNLPTQGKAIVVNIPAFELVAFEDATPVFRSRIIVGAPWHRTPRLETFTSTVRFRPTWRPTPAMVASGEYRDWVRPPGLNNPLGLAAVRLEPGLLVYLHDTNRRELFAEDMRARSHGCVRVEQWDVLVSWLLDMPLAQVHRIAEGSETNDYPTDKVPVFLAYLLRFPDKNGMIVDLPDIYNLGPPNPLPQKDDIHDSAGGACSGGIAD